MDVKHLRQVLFVLFFSALSCLGQTNTAFTYQGVLKSGNQPANGVFEVQFTLCDAPTNGTVVAPAIVESVPVTNGLFALNLDFGATAFNGASRWIEIAVRSLGDTNSMTVLAPRQAINPAPYAMFAYAAAIPEGTVTTRELAPGAVSGANIAPDSVVRSVNGIRDDVTVAAGSGVSVTPVGNTLQISLSTTDGLLDLTTNFVTASAGSSGDSKRWVYDNNAAYGIVGWGSPIGPVPRIDSLSFYIKPMSNSSISKVDVQIRKGDASGVVLVHSQLPVVGADLLSPVEVDWPLPTPITNLGLDVLYFQYVADGRVNVMTPSNPSYSYPTNQTRGNYWVDGVTNSLIAIASNPDDVSISNYRAVWSGTPTNNLCVWVQWMTNTDQIVLSHTAAWSNFINQAVADASLPVIQSLFGGFSSSVTQQLSSLSSTVSGIASNQAAAPRIILPKEMSAVVGDTLQIFLRGTVEAQNPYSIPTEMLCSIGTAYPRYFELTPTASQVGTYPLTINVLDNQGNTMNSATTMVRVVSAAEPSRHLNVLCVGDSLTSSGQWPQELYRRLTQNGGMPAGLGYGDIDFIGNSPIPGYSGQSYVGYGGWSWDTFLGTVSNSAAWLTCPGNDKDVTDQKSIYADSLSNQWQLETIQPDQIKVLPFGGALYTFTAPAGTLTWVSGGTHKSAINYTSIAPDAATPFWNGTSFSFTGFCATNGYSGIDVVYVLLGWNGLATSNAADPTNHAAAISKAQKFIDQLHSDYPNAKLRLMSLEVPSPTGGLGANYGAANFARYYKLLRSVDGLRLAYQQLANSANYSNFVGYVDIASQFDSENNMPIAQATVNSRNTNTEPRGLNGVHPSAPGYLEIADAAFRDFVRCFCQ